MSKNRRNSEHMLFSIYKHIFTFLPFKNRLKYEFPTYTNYTTITIICLFDILLCLQAFVSNNTCSVELYNDHLQTTTVLCTRNVSLYKTGWIITTRCLCCLVLFSPTQTVWRTFLKENALVLAFSRTLSRLHCCLCSLFTLLAVAFAYLLIPFSLMLVVVGLLGTNSMSLLM